MMRKVLFFLLATFAAASASTFKAQSVTPAFRPKQVLGIPRGGAIDIDTATVVKAHGYTSALIATTWVLETMGVEIPLMGLAATIKGFQMDGITKFFIRFLASIFVFVGLVEVNLAGNAQVQKFFKMYHVPAALSAIMLAKDHAKGPLGYMLPILVSAFTIGGFVF